MQVQNTVTAKVDYSIIICKMLPYRGKLLICNLGIRGPTICDDSWNSTSIMETRTKLPLDILLYIIDLLADEDDGDIKSLQILSQACKSMVPLCRNHLFSSLCLVDDIKSERFSNLLLKNPDIARYVRSLDYAFGIHNPVSEHDLNILDMLKKHSSLKSIAILSPGLDWNDLPEPIRSSLVSLIQLPTVARIGIYSIKWFPAMVLSGCSNLIDLQLREVELAPPGVNQVVSRCRIPTPVSLYIEQRIRGFTTMTLLNSTSLHTDGPIVDFSRLQRAEFDVESRSDFGPGEQIKVTTQLEHFSMYTCMNSELLSSLILAKFSKRIFLAHQPEGLAGLGASLAINAYKALEFLALTITVVGNDCDPLRGLSRELRFIAGNNILEELELDVMVQEGALRRTDSEDWSAFDSVLTASGAFPMLHRVSVKIGWYITEREKSEQDAIFESLKEDKFPRLVESKAVKFNFFAEVRG
jgi:hypothetical protein